MPQKSNKEEQPPEISSQVSSGIRSLSGNCFNICKCLLYRFFRYKTCEIVNNPQGEGAQENAIIRNLESFAEKVASDVLIPRSDIIAVNVDISLDELSKIVIKHGHTRTLVYKDNLDNILGFVHIKDLFEVIAKSKKYNLKKLTRKALVFPESMKLVDLLREMQVKRTHIAVIVDEYGGTDGIVTIEDLIEGIVGPIDDEHDIELVSESFKVLKPGVIIVSARMEVVELEKLLNVKLKEEDDEFDTIGGLVLATVGTVPEKGSVIDINDDVTVEIMDSTPRNIKQLKITCSKDIS